MVITICTLYCNCIPFLCCSFLVPGGLSIREGIYISEILAETRKLKKVILCWTLKIVFSWSTEAYYNDITININYLFDLCIYIYKHTYKFWSVCFRISWSVVVAGHFVTTVKYFFKKSLRNMSSVLLDVYCIFNYSNTH